MNTIDYNSVKDQLSMFMTDLTDSNYFNPRLSIIRVRSPLRNDQFFDFKLAPSWYPPNPKLHRVLLITSIQHLDDMGLSEDRLNFTPGIEDENWTPAEVTMGISYLIDRNQRLYTADNQTGSAAFSISKTNMFDQDKVKLSLTPPISRDYTNNSNQENDSNDIGIFMNNNTIMLRTRGSQITLGEEGLHFGGKAHWEYTTHSKEIMQDNFIHQLIPSTLPSAAIAIPQLPNFGMIAQIAATANKVINVVNTTTKVIDAIS